VVLLGGEHLEFFVVLGGRRGADDEQRLGLVLGEQRLAVDLDRAELGMDEDLVVGEALGDLVLLPQSGELLRRAAGRATATLGSPIPR
jgi:hypothetical protein